MQCRDVELVLEQEGLAPLPEAVRGHVAGCQHCQGFIGDLETIISVAVELPAEVEPPARVWVSLRNQLEQEGIIRETVTADQGASWLSRLGNLFRSRTLATAAAGLLIAVAGVVELQRPGTAVSPTPASAISPEIVKIVKQQEVDLMNMHLTGTSPVDASLEQNLQQVKQFIADCERHLKEVPQDELAREYLADAYQQEAELLAAMMDRGRSVN
ncbi:MAG TPA: hypothetical protein VE263_00665 [Candidatus Angelobacter sp.]|nr:hypothetical protein [Candidatus Angelobacter sp.]